MKHYEQCGLNEDQFKRFDGACWSTYQTIGGDLAELDGGRKQMDQIEVILDADYISMYGGGKDINTFYKDVVRPMLDKHYGKPHFIKMMKEIFPHKRYE
jgi:hypothetical protein